MKLPRGVDIKEGLLCFELRRGEIEKLHIIQWRISLYFTFQNIGKISTLKRI